MVDERLERPFGGRKRGGAGQFGRVRFVSERIEDAVSTIAGIKRLDSISRESLSMVLIEFELGVDQDQAAIDTQEKVEQIVREGNPAKEIASFAGEGDLLVISHRAGQKTSFFNPDTALQIITRCPCSVLALSHRERVHGAG